MKPLLIFQIVVFSLYPVVHAEIIPESHPGDWLTAGVQNGIMNYHVAAEATDFRIQGHGTSVATKLPDAITFLHIADEPGRDTDAKTRYGLSIGFSGYGIRMKTAKTTDTIYYKKYGFYSDDPDTLLPDFSNYGTSGFLAGLSISIDLYQINHSDFFSGFHVTFGKEQCGFSSTLMDVRFGYEIPVIKDRLSLPVGLAGTFGRCSFEIDYAQELQSHLSDFNIGVDESTFPTTVRAATFGACLFSGLRIVLQNNIGAYFTIGYRYHNEIDSWKGSNRFLEWDTYSSEYVSSLNEYEIDEKWLPFRDVQPAGIDIHTGISWLW
jgi:hypothetical protein